MTGPEEVDLQDALNQWAADAVPMRRWAEPTQPGVGVVVLGTDPGDNVAWKALLSLGIVVLLIFCVIVPLTPGRIWKRVGSQFEMRTLEVSEQGIHRVTALTDALMRWPTFSEAIQRGDLYLLRIGLGPGMFLIP
ncbi:MAG TPA: hypothetical protein VFC03_02990 [Acidimicrobiales bacterium]|nr:hypothetical protein [Acidimicrobiales bacterium]